MVVVAALALFAGFVLLFSGIKGHVSVGGKTVAIWHQPWALIALWFSGRSPKG